jgi:uncharacterized membrane protein
MNGAKKVDKETGRVEAFSDGVFAIAITLLILEIKVPQTIPADKGLFDELLDKWPSFLAFVNSFLTILVMWINHHRLFTHIRRSNTLLLFFNGLLLLGVTFLPYPTSVVAEYIQDKEQNPAVMFYCGCFIVIALFFNLLWRYAAHKNRLLDKNANQVAVKSITRAYNIGPFLYLVAFGLAIFNGIISLLFTLALAIFFAIPDKAERTLEAAEAQ